MTERERAVDVAIAQIERQFGKGSIMKMKPGEVNPMQVDAIPTGSIALDLALGIGGVPRGRIVEIYGPESSGKTTLALHIVSEAQKLGGLAAIIDAEHALDPVYAGRLGVKYTYGEVDVHKFPFSFLLAHYTRQACRDGTLWQHGPRPVVDPAHRAFLIALRFLTSL